MQKCICKILFCVHFTEVKCSASQKKKEKAKKKAFSAILTFYQVKTKYYVFCEQNAEIRINIGF